MVEESLLYRIPKEKKKKIDKNRIEKAWPKGAFTKEHASWWSRALEEPKIPLFTRSLTREHYVARSFSRSFRSFSLIERIQIMDFFSYDIESINWHTFGHTLNLARNPFYTFSYEISSL